MPKDVTLHFHETRLDIHSVSRVMKRDTHGAWDLIENIGEDKKRLFLYFMGAKEEVVIPLSSPILKESEQ